MSKYLTLLLFLTLGMIGYHNTTAIVTNVSRGVTTMMADGYEYQIESDEAWRVGDMATCVMFENGTEDKSDDKIIFANYVWRR